MYITIIYYDLGLKPQNLFGRPDSMVIGNTAPEVEDAV